MVGKQHSCVNNEGGTERVSHHEVNVQYQAVAAHK